MSTTSSKDDDRPLASIVVDFSDVEESKEVTAPKEESAASSASGGSRAAPKATSVAKSAPKNQRQKSTQKSAPSNSKVAESPAKVIAVKAKKTKEELEAEAAKRRAAEELVRAKAKAEAEAEAAAERAAKYEAQKNRFSGMLSNADGQSRTDGDIGMQSGQSKQEALDGISEGVAEIGDGLGTRQLLSSPKIKDSSQKTGKVIIKLCVDQSGSVISAQFTQRGSTTTDRELIDLAVKNAKKYKFSKSDFPRQCGSISVDFKLN